MNIPLEIYGIYGKIDILNKKERNAIKVNTEINIFKKIWYSIGKPKKYEEMSQEGIKKAIKYISILIILFSFIVSGLVVIKIHENYNEQIEYVQSNIPELTYKEGVLKLETEKELILSHQIVEQTIGGKVIINTNEYNDELKKSYLDKITTEGKYGVILFSEKMIMVAKPNEEIQTKEYEYTEVFETYFDEDLEFNKKDVINYLEEIPYSNYYITYCVTYFLSMFIIMAFNAVVMSIIGLIYAKILKINTRYKNILCMAIYATTIAVILNIIYSIIQFIFNISIPFFDIIYIAVPYIYLVIALLAMKPKVEKN